MSNFNETLKTPSFWVNYDSSWEFEKQENPPLYILHSNSTETKITFSSMSYPKGKDLNMLANSYLNLRLDSEKELLKSSGYSTPQEIESSVKEIPIGFQIEFWGTDNKSRSFRYWAVVTETKLVNIYLESYGLSGEKLDDTFRGFLKNLKI